MYLSERNFEFFWCLLTFKRFWCLAILGWSFSWVWSKPIPRYFVFLRFLDFFLFSWGFSMLVCACCGVIVFFLSFLGSTMNLFLAVLRAGVVVLFVVVVCVLFSVWVSVGVLVCFCGSFVVFDRLNAFVLVGILLTRHK